MKNSSGSTKFVTLSKPVKIILSLSYGNTRVERAFSENASLLTDDRSSLSGISINGLRATKDAIKFYGSGNIHMVPVGKGLMGGTKEAYSRHRTDQEKMQQLLKQKEETEAAAKSLKDQELRLIEKENRLVDERKLSQHELENASKMLEESNARLEAAVATKNFADVEVAQLLIEGANKKLDVLKT